MYTSPSSCRVDVTCCPSIAGNCIRAVMIILLLSIRCIFNDYKLSHSIAFTRVQCAQCVDYIEINGSLYVLGSFYYYHYHIKRQTIKFNTETTCTRRVNIIVVYCAIRRTPRRVMQHL